MRNSILKFRPSEGSQVVIAISDGKLVGATVPQQEFYNALLAHEREESEIISAYEAFAEDASSDAVRYLISMVLDDERSIVGSFLS